MRRFMGLRKQRGLRVFRTTLKAALHAALQDLAEFVTAFRKQSFELTLIIDIRMNVSVSAPTASLDDWGLLSAYVRGDEAAFAGLVGKYFPMVYATASRHTGDPHLAEEIAQSVFIILSRKAGRLSSGVSICGWLMQATRFVAWDAVKMRRRRRQNEQAFEASLDRAAPAPAARSTTEALLDDALLALPPADQAAVMAHFFEGRNFKEVGGMLAISEDAAQKRVSRSLAKMRSFLARRGVRITPAALTGLVIEQFAREAKAQVLESALHATQAAVGKGATGKALALANHAARWWSWRSALSLGLKLALPVLLIVGGAEAVREWRVPALPPAATFRVSSPQMEALGKSWAQLAVRIAAIRRQNIARPLQPNDPRLPAYQAELNFAMSESARVVIQLAPMLIPPLDRVRLAEFLTVELNENLHLNKRQEAVIFAYIRDALSQGTTLDEAMKTMAQSTQAETAQIRAMLSVSQRRRFDSTYGADGLGLFAYVQAAAPPN